MDNTKADRLRESRTLQEGKVRAIGLLYVNSNIPLSLMTQGQIGNLAMWYDDGRGIGWACMNSEDLPFDWLFEK